MIEKRVKLQKKNNASWEKDLSVLSAFLVLIVWSVGSLYKLLFKIKYSTKLRLYVLYTLSNFISKLNWKSVCNIQMTELGGWGWVGNLI